MSDIFDDVGPNELADVLVRLLSDAGLLAAIGIAHRDVMRTLPEAIVAIVDEGGDAVDALAFLCTAAYNWGER